MPAARSVRTLAGLGLWCGAAAVAGAFLAEERGQRSSTVAALADYCSQRPARLEIRFPGPVFIEVGATVEIEGEAPAGIPPPGARGEVVGAVEALLDREGRVLSDVLFGEAQAVAVRLHDRERPSLRADARARLVQVPQTFEWVVRTLFTEEAVARIAEEWNRAMLEHREELFAVFTPVVRALILDGERLMESELPAFLERHREEAKALGDAVENDLGGEKLVELFSREIQPIAEKNLKPVLEDIGREIWKEFPLWSLSWRFMYQSLPLTDDDYFRRAWAQFVESRVVPILKNRSAEILASIRATGREAFSNPEVAAHFRRAFSDLVSSPRFQELAQKFIKEAMLDNERFHALLRAHWESPQVQAAVRRASLYLEPMIRRMGDIVLGTRADGITRDFARVLRSQIFLKDQQRLILEPGRAAAPLPPRASILATVMVEGED
jgi:hypothetical protein